MTGLLYLAFGTAALLFAYLVDWRTPDHAHRARLCDRSRYTNHGEALFIKEAGDAYVTGCFGPALPI